MAETDEEIETWFLVPLVRNSDRQTHAAPLWACLREEVFAIPAGMSGPECWRKDDPVPGEWRDPKTGERVEDESRKYTIVLRRSRVEALRDVLWRAANSFDQEEILFLVRGVKTEVKRDASKGILKGDPAGG